MILTAEMVEALSGMYLSQRYDSPQPTPEFHRECWRMYCSEHPACAVAAPRNHAKSTSLTHDYGLAAALFRMEPYIIIVGASEDMAIEHLADIASELRENEDLIKSFKIKDFITDQKTDIIVECEDGYQFRFIARGAEQKIRGRKWRSRRPGLIIFDDIEDDEQVESKERRSKFRRWFFRACKQALRDGGKIRGHGTILHEDSLLNRLMRNRAWDTKLYKAHRSFDEFVDVLWPEKFPVQRLIDIRQEFINEGDAAGYSQEYLNDPFDNEDAYLRRDDYIPMSDKEREYFKTYCASIDFAISKADKANRTSLTVGGLTTEDILYFVDQRVARIDAKEIIELMFEINNAWSIDTFFVEGGQIWKAIEPILNAEMTAREEFINIQVINPVKDKKARGRSWQKRMRLRKCRFDTDAEWFDDFKQETLRFTGNSEATLDDQFDSASLLARGFEGREVKEEDALTDEELEFIEESDSLRPSSAFSDSSSDSSGRSAWTGY